MAASPEPEDVYDDDGTDRSLIRWFLSLTPEERLSSIDDAAELAELAGRDGVQLVRAAFRATLDERRKARG